MQCNRCATAYGVTDRRTDIAKLIVAFAILLRNQIWNPLNLLAQHEMKNPYVKMRVGGFPLAQTDVLFSTNNAANVRMT